MCSVTEDTSVGQHGPYRMVQSSDRKEIEFVPLNLLNLELEGKEIWVRGRVRAIRSRGKMCFIVLTTGVYGSGVNHRHSRKGCGQENRLLYQRTVELSAQQVFVVSAAEPRLPLQIEDASRPVDDETGLAAVNLDTRLDNRVLDLRTPTSQGIFAIQSGVCRLFRSILTGRGFTEIHTPKIISAASEGGAGVFEVNYFKGTAYLAQSPQLYKEMAIAGDFDKSEFAYEIAAVNTPYPVEPFQFCEPALVLKYPEAVALLRELRRYSWFQLPSPSQMKNQLERSK